jgi:serine/threonine-protein kinase PknK
LFVERARAVVPEFALTEDNKTSVARICSRLDGLPLAIELATARLRALSLEEVADGLAEHYDLLGRGRRRAAARQQTLTLCVQWSYDLCSPPEQQLWARLSVFAGSFGLQTAHDICGQGSGRAQFLDQLSALVDKSILIRTEHRGAVRFRLLETLRDYGKSRIGEHADESELRRRHAQWYHRLLVEARAQWFTAQQLTWLDRLTVELPNIRVALQFSVSDSTSPLQALEMAAALRPYLYARGMFTEGIRWLDLALGAAPPEPTPQRLDALCGAIKTLGVMGDLEGAQPRIAEARSILELLNDPGATAVCDNAEGYAALNRGEIELARDHLRRAIAASDDYEAQVGSLIVMGWVHDIFGEHHDASSCFEKALALADARGESMWRSMILGSAGVGRWRVGDSEGALQALRQGLHLAMDVNDPGHVIRFLAAMAWIVGSNGHHRRAVVLMAACAVLARAKGVPLHPIPHLATFYEECERNARAALAPAEFDAAWQEGGAL